LTEDETSTETADDAGQDEPTVLTEEEQAKWKRPGSPFGFLNPFHRR
jgi:hypothetical protein